MYNFKLTTPVLFIIFNRPQKTKRVFDEIRRTKPSRLIIAADGPRKDVPGDQEVCQQTREIVQQVDWDCELSTLFREENLGSPKNISSAINWLFEDAEEGIILEDDCLPETSFFRFCQELLSYYRDDTRVMHISGNNFQRGRTRGDGSYYFSRFSHVWGWATWKRAWQYYDLNMATFPKFREQNQIINIVGNKRMRDYFLKIFQAVYDGRIITWAYQWTYTILSQNGLCAVPNVNLVRNIGFGEGATHTFDPESRQANMLVSRIESIVHPSFVTPNQKADEFEIWLHREPLSQRAKNRLKRILNKP